MRFVYGKIYIDFEGGFYPIGRLDALLGGFLKPSRDKEAGRGQTPNVNEFNMEHLPECGNKKSHP